MKSRGERRVGNEARGRRPGGPKSSLRAKPKEAQRAFEQRYPDVEVDPALFRLVGVDPPLSVEREKAALREALVERSTSK